MEPSQNFRLTLAGSGHSHPVLQSDILSASALWASPAPHFWGQFLAPFFFGARTQPKTELAASAAFHVIVLAVKSNTRSACKEAN